MGDPERQFLLLHGAGSGHDRQLPAADLHAIHVDDRVVFLELASRELPGRQNRDHLFDPGDGPERVVGEQPVVADHADDGPLLPLREVGAEAELPHAVHHVLDLFFRGVWFQHDNHETALLITCSALPGVLR